MQCNIQIQPPSILPTPRLPSPPPPKKKKKHKVEQACLKQNILERTDVAKQNP